MPVDTSVRERRPLWRAESSLVSTCRVSLPSLAHLGAISTLGGRPAAAVVLAEVHGGSFL